MYRPLTAIPAGVFVPTMTRPFTANPLSLARPMLPRSFCPPCGLCVQKMKPSGDPWEPPQPLKKPQTAATVATTAAARRCGGRRVTS
jgi:hypothetical protein